MKSDPMGNDELIEAVASVASATKRLADAVTPNVVGTNDAAGSHVESLTEAVMGITAGLCRIADAIGELAEAVRGHRQ